MKALGLAMIFGILFVLGSGAEAEFTEHLTKISTTSEHEHRGLRCRRIQRAVQTAFASDNYASLRVEGSRRGARTARKVVKSLLGYSVKRRSVGRGCLYCISRQVKRRIPLSEQAACGAHDLCAEGGALARSFSPCVKAVCADDPSCCRKAWDGDCAAAARKSCGETCVACAHDEAESGAALDPSCSACAAQVCGVDPFCCDSLWSDECVGKAQLLCAQDLDTSTTLPPSPTTTVVEEPTSSTLPDGGSTLPPTSTTVVSAEPTTTLPAPGGETECCSVINFEEHPPGTQVSTVETSLGQPLTVKGTNPKLGTEVNASILYDSRCPSGCTGSDTDLGTPNEDFGGPGIGEGGGSGSPTQNDEGLGNLLIIATSLEDADANGLVDRPNDQKGTTVTQELDFSAFAPVSVLGLKLVDVGDTEGPARVELFDVNGNSIAAATAPNAEDNGLVKLELPPNEGVWKMIVTLHGSGGVDEIRLGCPDVTTTTVPVTTTTLGGPTTTTGETTTTTTPVTTTIPGSTTTLPVPTTTIPVPTTTLPLPTTTLPVPTTTLPVTTTTVPVTTTTLPVTTTTLPVTTTTVPVTTTTLPVLDFECAVTFGVTSAHTVGALQYQVDYSGIVGGFAGEGFGVECTPKIAASGSISDDDAAKLLNQSIISSAGFATPAAVAECVFETNDEGLSAQDFVITVLAASDTGLNPLEATMAATFIDCVPAGAAQSDQCVIDFQVTNTTDVLTALQFGAAYAAAPAGGFAKNGCTLTPLGGLTDVNDNKTTKRLTIAYADNGSTFDGPGLFASCNYISTTGVLPTAPNFGLTLDDASEGVPPTLATPQPTMSVSVGSCTQVDPVCGNGVVEAGETCDDGNLADGDGCSAACTPSLLLRFD